MISTRFPWIPNWYSTEAVEFLWVTTISLEATEAWSCWTFLIELRQILRKDIREHPAQGTEIKILSHFLCTHNLRLSCLPQNIRLHHLEKIRADAEHVLQERRNQGHQSCWTNSKNQEWLKWPSPFKKALVKRKADVLGSSPLKGLVL